MMVPKPDEAQGRQIDNYLDRKPNRYVRHIPELYSDWCDRCRMFTSQPENHRHEERPLD